MRIDVIKNKFHIFVKISLIIYIIVLILAIMLKTFMINDLIISYNYLSTFTLKERFIRGINLIEFYKIEYELGIINKTIILDILNCIVFIPYGIFVAHFIKKDKIVKTLLITLGISLFFELFQLVTIIGSFMLNDLITNVVGGIIGSVLYILIIKIKKYNIFNILLCIFIIIEIIIMSYLFVNLINNISVYVNFIKF